MCNANGLAHAARRTTSAIPRRAAPAGANTGRHVCSDRRALTPSTMLEAATRSHPGVADGDARWRCKMEMRGGQMHGHDPDARWMGVIHTGRVPAPMRRTNGGRAPALGRPVPAGGVGGSRHLQANLSATAGSKHKAGSLWQDGLLASHVRPEDLGDRERAVLVLVVFEDGDEGAPDRQPRAVDGVAEDRLLCLALGVSL